jgi:hypothetical protein
MSGVHPRVHPGQRVLEDPALVTLFSSGAFTFMLKLCSSLSLIPYLLAAAYALKLGARGET